MISGGRITYKDQRTTRNYIGRHTMEKHLKQKRRENYNERTNFILGHAKRSLTHCSPIGN